MRFDQELHQFSRIMDWLEKQGQMPVSTLSNATDTLLQTIEDSGACPEDQFKLVARAIVGTPFPSVLHKLVHYAKDKLARDFISDDVLEAALIKLSICYKAQAQNPYHEELLAHLWTACADQIKDSALGSRVRERAIMIADEGSVLFRSAAKRVVKPQPALLDEPFRLRRRQSLSYLPCSHAVFL